jgi:hypothetical protein
MLFRSLILSTMKMVATRSSETSDVTRLIQSEISVHSIHQLFLPENGRGWLHTSLTDRERRPFWQHPTWLDIELKPRICMVTANKNYGEFILECSIPCIIWWLSWRSATFEPSKGTEIVRLTLGFLAITMCDLYNADKTERRVLWNATRQHSERTSLQLSLPAEYS